MSPITVAGGDPRDFAVTHDARGRARKVPEYLKRNLIHRS
jgi:hypothetical protein